MVRLARSGYFVGVTLDIFHNILELLTIMNWEADLIDHCRTGDPIEFADCRPVGLIPAL